MEERVKIENIKVFHPEDQFFDIMLSLISIVLRETTLTISDLISEPISMESQTVRVVSLCPMEISKIT